MIYKMQHKMSIGFITKFKRNQKLKHNQNFKDTPPPLQKRREKINTLKNQIRN